MKAPLLVESMALIFNPFKADTTWFVSQFLPLKRIFRPIYERNVSLSYASLFHSLYMINVLAVFVWFGLPHALGLELVTLNPQLGAYFGADSGVLVIQAEEDNDLQLQSGDVILAINSETVESPSDLMRALREAESGDSVDVTIRRDQKDVTLDVVIPDNRFGLRIETHRADRH